MAIVKDYYSPEGCHIIVHDDFYRNISPEENQARLNRAAQIVLREEFRKFIQTGENANYECENCEKDIGSSHSSIDNI